MIVCALQANAQDYKKFRVGLGVGYASASGEGAKGGVILALEPGYRIQDKILVNLRVESAAIVRGTTEQVNGLDIEVAAIGSYTLNGQYYLRAAGFRPYAGFGFGVYTLSAITVEDNGGTGGDVDVAAAESKFGFYPRIGFDAGHFNFNIDFNILPQTEGIGGSEFKNSYIGFRLSAFIGGGAK